MAVSDLDRTDADRRAAGSADAPAIAGAGAAALATAGPAVPPQASVPGLAAIDDAHPKDAHRMSQPTEPTSDPSPPQAPAEPSAQQTTEPVTAAASGVSAPSAAADGGADTDTAADGAAAPAAAGAPGRPAVPAQPTPHRSGAPDREAARALFVRLSALPDGSPERVELRNQLVRMHIPLVEHLARRFRNRGEPLDDLTQVATIGLIKSVDRFDHERGVEFSTYATPTIVGEIKRHFRDKGWAVRVPRRLQELRLSLTTATSELSQRHGRSPTVHELAEHLGISEEDVLEGLESANAYSTLSLDVPDSDDESPAVADTLGTTDEALEGVEYRESLKPLLAQLPPREQKILVLRFFRNMTQSQIATEVGISQMHVSRLLARTLAQLREKLLVEE
ncbi:SigB/SigF/SigG family RNA polymerase sigma factor [Kitasatospora sp. NPDC057223]|uniref:RNA polymerase sigma factor SigF n=1 Tax=Kitasatospora sp. NPDC057223 TaxID=3346055 RepID=UPI0036454095